MQTALSLAERGLVPDWLIRMGIRRLLSERLRQSETDNLSSAEATSQFARSMLDNPLVVAADDANRQHYEVPTELFQHSLGAAMKYSCGFWPAGVDSLDASEQAMLELTARRAGIEDGMRVLDLGCGWGSLSLWLAERYPGCQIHAVSNSATQRDWIESQCRRRELKNLSVTTCSVADFAPDQTYDRIASVEMFEHVRNYDELLRRTASWLVPGGRLFVHVFCHAERPYYFETAGSGDWMARHFFTGGIMPSRDLLTCFPNRMVVESQWTVAGTHYQQTCEAWLVRFDENRETIEQALAAVDAPDPPRLLAQRWRMFFMACAELFAFDQGRQWHVEHYLLRQPA